MVFKKSAKHPRFDRSILVIGVGLPLFHPANGIRSSLILIGSALLSVLILEALFNIVKRFWLRSFRPLFVIIVSATVVQGIFLVVHSKAWIDFNEAASFLPLVLMCALLLGFHTISTLDPLSGRIRLWAEFSFLVFVVGIVREWIPALVHFSPTPFWLSAWILAFVLFYRTRWMS